MLYQILPAVLVSLSSILITTRAQNPWFCQTYDCPAFTPESRNGYEIRNYAETKWIASSVESSSPEPSRSDTRVMFRKLFKYISGSNVNDQKIDMTVPVLTKIETQGNQYKFTMMFYLPLSNPPSPRAGEGVFLVTKPAGPVFVKSFPSWWWPLSSTYRRKVGELKNEIADSSLYNDNVYYKAGYNSPYDIFVRKQHEVWVDSL